MTRNATGQKIVGGLGLVWIALAAALYLSAPQADGGADWQKAMIPGGWMAWTLSTAAFFWVIGALLITFTLLALRFPETERRGVLGIETTRGDRLFITLLGSAFINLAWLGLSGMEQPYALILCLIYAAAVFRFV